MGLGSLKSYVSDQAFLGIVLSSIEVYKKECFGILLGYKDADYFIVQYAIPFQSAERKFGEVEIDFRRESSCLRILPQLSQLRHIGYFHSHTQWGGHKASTEPSDIDAEGMREGDLEMIIAINEKQKTLKWNYVKSKELTGAIGDYFLRIAAYNISNDKLQRLEIQCPYALGFDLTFEQ
jgi:proteasome lid subunit RPN8/RPN11